MIDPATASPVALLLVSAAGAVALTRSPATFGRLVRSPLALVVSAGIALLAVPKMVVSYIAPCEFLQDTVSAGELLAGRTAYPTDLRPTIHAIFDKQLPWAPRALRSFQASQLRCGRELEINAHPPFLTVATEPLVASMGYYAPMLAMNAISLGSIAAMLWMLARGFGITVGWRAWTVIACLTLGCQPVLSTLRMANQSVLLAALLTGAWYLLRRRREGLAGMVIAVAVCIKVYPAIALGALLYTGKRVKALLAAGAVLVASCAIVFFLYGRGIFEGYLWTAHAVSTYYRWMRNNYASDIYAVTTTVVSVLFVLTAAVALIRARRTPALRRDVAMALAATLTCLVSPVVWTHYFIVLTLPLFTISYYSQWWRSARLTTMFRLLAASVNLHDATVAALSALVQIDAVWSIPTLGTVGIFAWLIRIAVAPSESASGETESGAAAILFSGMATSR